jgi:hypothetical protein
VSIKRQTTTKSKIENGCRKRCCICPLNIQRLVPPERETSSNRFSSSKKFEKKTKRETFSDDTNQIRKKRRKTKWYVFYFQNRKNLVPFRQGKIMILPCRKGVRFFGFQSQRLYPNDMFQ